MNADPATPVRAGSLAAWSAAVRTRSQSVAVSPVLVGGALRFVRTGAIDPAALLVLAVALQMQVTNRQNNVGGTAAIASAAIGALAAAALAVNNHRDIAHDRLVGRRTFAVTFGEAGSRRLYAALLLLPFALLPVLAWQAGAAALLLPALLVPAAWRLYRRFVHGPRGSGLNEVLFRTFRLELWFAALLAAGALAGRIAG